MLLFHYVIEMYYSSLIKYEFIHGTMPKCLDNQRVRMMEVWIIEVELYMGIIDIIL